jgi:hypothetical protein
MGVAGVVAATFVLAVSDARRTARWWVETIGFEIWLEPEGWVFLRRGACVLRLGSCPDAIDPHDLSDHQYFGYVEVDDLDAYHAEIAARNAELLFPPTSQPWGMREMGVRTPTATASCSLR